MLGLCGMRQTCLSNSSFVLCGRLCKNSAAVNRHSFGVIRAVAEHPKGRKPRPSSNDYIIPVVSFVKSHLAANAGNYPKVALIVQETGGSPYIVRKIINAIRFGNLDINGKDPIDNSQEANADKVLFNECVAHADNGKGQEHSGMPICSVAGRSDQEDAHTAEFNVVEDSALKDVPDLICKEHENTGILVSCEVERLNQEDVHTAVEEIEQTQVPDCKPSSQAEDAREDDHVKWSLQHTKNRLQTDDNTAVSQAVALQLKPPHQKTAGSRRVNLSTVMGLENDLLWKETLSSISPGPRVRQNKVITEQLNTKVRKNKVITEQLNTKVRQNKVVTEQLNTNPMRYCISLSSTKTKSILGNISRAAVSETFQKCDIFKVYFARTKSSAEAFIYFKTEEGLHKALSMNPLLLKGEEVRVERVSPAVKEETVEWVPPAAKQKFVKEISSTAVEETEHVFDGVIKALTGVTSRITSVTKRGKGPTSTTSGGAADVFSSILSTLGSDSSGEFSLLHNLNRVQNTISVDKCPVYLPLDTLKDFFLRYGEVLSCISVAREGGEQTCYIEFKNEEVKKKALEIPRFIIDGNIFQIRNDENPGTLVVRLENIHSNTSTRKVMDICQTHGEVQNVTARGPNVMDVQFGQGEKSKIGEILDRLDEVTLDTQKWQAKLLCHGFEKVVNLENTCEVCLQRRQDNLKLLSLAKQLLMHIEDMCKG